MHLWELEEVDQTSGGAPLHPAPARGSSSVHMGAAEIRGLSHHLKANSILKHEYVYTEAMCLVIMTFIC